MKHIDEESMTLYHYGEAENSEEISEHLSSCSACRSAFGELRRVLAAVHSHPVPVRDQAYGREVWLRLQPKLRQKEMSTPKSSKIWVFLNLLKMPRWAPVPIAASLLFAAFWLGRQWPDRSQNVVVTPTEQVAPIDAEARERVLLREIGNHLERSQVALIELVNSRTNDLVDISLEQKLARQLVEVNRLYRKAAVRLGESGAAGVLDSLERTLIELANQPSELPFADFVQLRDHINSEGLLFKVKVIQGELKLKEREANQIDQSRSS